MPGTERALANGGTVIAYAGAAISLAIWIYLLCARGGFWRASAHLAATPQPERLATNPRSASRVAVIIPARNEAPLIGAALRSLIEQQYPGCIEIFVIDDGSTDGTADVATATAAQTGVARAVRVLRGASLQPGWTGKLWAMSQGVAAAAAVDADYLLFTDADIHHAPDSVATLIGLAETSGADLVSCMAQLCTRRLAERSLIPAFVFFFFMIYPPAWVADNRARTAAAAGGCMLIRPHALARAGGLGAIHDQLIDDCALARAVKASGGRLWLGLTHRVRSLRGYGSFAEIGAMISRTAFSQLRHSYWLLVATLCGLGLTYLLPPLLLFTHAPIAAALGACAWLLMTLAYLPTVRFYDRAWPWSLTLPLVATFYAAATLSSAVQYGLGRGGRWKDRVQDARA